MSKWVVRSDPEETIDFVNLDISLDGPFSTSPLLAVAFALTLGIAGHHAPASPIFHIPVSKFV